MSLESGLRLLVFLLIFGFSNYVMMLIRYEQDVRKRKIIQKNKISNLYPKSAFIYK